MQILFTGTCFCPNPVSTPKVSSMQEFSDQESVGSSQLLRHSFWSQQQSNLLSIIFLLESLNSLYLTTFLTSFDGYEVFSAFHVASCINFKRRTEARPVMKLWSSFILSFYRHQSDTMLQSWKHKGTIFSRVTVSHGEITVWITQWFLSCTISKWYVSYLRGADPIKTTISR